MNDSNLARLSGLVALTLFLAAYSPLDVPSEGSDASAATPAIHFELRSSAPMADSTVAPPTAVTLVFTQKPQEGATQIRVMKAEVLVPSGDVMQDPDDDTEYSVSFEQPLSTGAYRVLWRSMAADGHVVDGEFGFMVATPDR